MTLDTSLNISNASNSNLFSDFNLQNYNSDFNTFSEIPPLETLKNEKQLLTDNKNLLSGVTPLPNTNPFTPTQNNPAENNYSLKTEEKTNFHLPSFSQAVSAAGTAASVFNTTVAGLGNAALIGRTLAGFAL